VAESISTDEEMHHIYFAPETANRCIPLLAKAQTMTLPLMNGERALLQVKLPRDNSRRLIGEMHGACRAR
jgi:hypothetical protein